MTSMVVNIDVCIVCAGGWEGRMGESVWAICFVGMCILFTVYKK